MDTPTRLEIFADLKNLSVIRRYVETRGAALGAAPAVLDDLLLAVDEAATNVIVHGYRGEPGILEIEMQRAGDTLVTRLRDQAPSFDPNTVPPPDLSIPLDQRPFGGMGIYLMRISVDEIHYQVRPQGGNELILVKRLATGAEP